MKSKIFFPAVAIGIAVIFYAWVLYEMGLNTEVPQEMKLVECTNSTLKVHLRIPKGNTYSLVLATPGTGMFDHSTNRFSGHLRISDGTLTTVEIPIGSDYAEQCNWLHDSSALILTRGANCADLSRFIRPQVDYEIKITFDQPPSSSTSIWLCWLQTAKDKGK